MMVHGPVLVRKMAATPRPLSATGIDVPLEEDGVPSDKIRCQKCWGEWGMARKGRPLKKGALRAYRRGLCQPEIVLEPQVGSITGIHEKTVVETFGREGILRFLFFQSFEKNATQKEKRKITNGQRKLTECHGMNSTTTSGNSLSLCSGDM
jgi:hypothetical protein